jgi:hypothetical protein
MANTAWSTRKATGSLSRGYRRMPESTPKRAAGNSMIRRINNGEKQNL